MNLEAIDKVIDFLKKLHPSNFDLCVVVYGEIVDLKAITKEPEIPRCGTAGCVYGYFPAIFPEQYRWRQVPFGDPVVERLVDNEKGMTYKVAQILDISIPQARRIIDPMHYSSPVTKEMVIERLELIKGEYNVRS